MDTRKEQAPAASVSSVLNFLEKNIDPCSEINLPGPQVAWITSEGEMLTQPPRKRLATLAKMVNDLSLDRKQDVNQHSQQQNQKTLLIEATIQNEHSLATVLLDHEHNADPSLCDDKGYNAFMHAARLGHMRILNEFLSMVQQKPVASQKNESSSKKEDSPKKLEGEATQGTSKETSETKKPALQAGSQKQNSQSASQKEASKKSSRLQLPHTVLEHTVLEHTVLQDENKSHTLQSLLEDYRNKLSAQNGDEEKDPQANAQKPIALLDRIKNLVQEIEVRKPKDARELKEDLAKAEIAKRNHLQRKTEMLATAVSLDFNRKKDQLSHYYDLFFNKKQSFWGPRIHKTAENDQARVQAYEERESLRQRHGLVLFASDQALSEEKLKERFPEPQDPILIKKTIRAGARTVEKEQFSIYGYGHKWTETILNDELVKALKENKSLMDAFSKLKAGEDIALTPDKAANLFADQLKQEEFKQDEAVDLLADQQEQEEFKQDEAADLFANQPEQEEFKQDENYNLESIIRLYHTPDLANHHSNKVIEYPVKTNQAGKALLPLSIGDQIKSRAALSLIKDYYAPKGWLPSFFTQCTRGEYGHLLRRAFNFHWGRRYCTEARGLYLELSTQSLKTTEDFRLFYKKIKGEFERFDEVNSHLPQLQVEKKKRLNEVNSQLPQLQVEEEKESKEVNSQLPQLVVESEAKKKIDNRKGKHNNPFQSSYLRRLNYILNSLEETLAYQQQTGLSDQVYLDSLDMRDYMNNTTTPKPK